MLHCTEISNGFTRQMVVRFIKIINACKAHIQKGTTQQTTPTYRTNTKEQNEQSNVPIQTFFFMLDLINKRIAHPEGKIIIFLEVK